MVTSWIICPHCQQCSSASATCNLCKHCLSLHLSSAWHVCSPCQHLQAYADEDSLPLNSVVEVVGVLSSGSPEQRSVEERLGGLSIHGNSEEMVSARAAHRACFCASQSTGCT